jgi:EAL domain-containing protein (putative c-di-GMP-specific phosphodiesterase class I)
VLQGLSCDFAQGYLYSRPLTLDGLRSFTATAATGTLIESK